MEDYQKAADTRLSDWEVLCREKRKSGAIHLGGIYIECLLKSMICQMYPVLEQGNRWVAGSKAYSRPSHALTSSQYTYWLNDIYDDMPSDVEEALEYITEPESIRYIDYRYRDESSVTDEVYDKWQEYFVCLFDYLEQKKSEV